MGEIDRIKALLERLKEETSIGLSEHDNGVEQGRMEIIEAIYDLLTSRLNEEEHVNEDLEREISNEINRYTKFCEKCLKEMEDDNTDISFMDLRHFAAHFVNWQKQQMMKDAVDGWIEADDNRDMNVWARSDDFRWLNKNITASLNIGDKVKLIIIKEE